MKIAIPLFRNRVSPYFGSSSKLLLIEMESSNHYKEDILEIKEKGPMEIARRLLSLGVDRVICGGIERYYKDWLIKKGIQVVDNQRGLARKIARNLFKT
jgi:predicted Fe-Mo cluster-binding NifX family protein